MKKTIYFFVVLGLIISFTLSSYSINYQPGKNTYTVSHNPKGFYIYSNREQNFNKRNSNIYIILEGNLKTDDMIHNVVSEKAKFAGGIPSLFKWLHENLVYPDCARENEIMERVVVSFIVEKDGTLTNPIITKSINNEIDEEAMRLVKIMPKWEPAKLYGDSVRSVYELPISFRYKGI